MQQLEQSTHYYTRNERTRKTHFGIRYRHVHPDKKDPHNDELEELNSVRPHVIVHNLQMRRTFHRRMNKNVNTCAANNHYRYQHYNRNIGRCLTQYGTRFAYIPYHVKGGLHGLKERINRPKKNQNTDSDEHTALCGLQVSVNH